MGAGAAAHAAMVNAIKATGVVVRLEPGDWMQVLSRTERPLVVIGRGGVFKKRNQYLTSYRGLAFFTTTADTLVMPPRCEIVQAKSISVPDL
jgi:hypothetical protein